MYDVITIGTATRDVFSTSPLFKIVKDPKHLQKMGFPTGEAQCFALGGKIEVGAPVLTTGGGATNAAVTFARQELKSAALVKIGDDESASAIINELKKEKIAPFAVVKKNASTAYSTILLAPSGERTILVYRGASEDLKTDEIPFDNLKARWAYIVPGKIPFAVIENIVNHFSKNKTMIAFNPSKHFIEMGLKKLKPLLTKIKVVILNREEAASLTGVNYENEKEIFRKLDEAVAGIAVMTDGGKGVLISDGHAIYSAGVFKEKFVADRTGAGDAFGSGFVAGLAQKKENCRKGLCRPFNIEYAARLGSANATSVIEKIGAKAGILTKKEFEKDARWKRLPMKTVYQASGFIF
ncbi:carbohydrate kinase family protein [Candidatus Wolfebacteria bacterium]|nr:carbohydrate kinase family protein [Candidatus Wolfebacteria bacterium]